MPETTTMPVAVTVILNVDTHGWTRDYGIEGADEIRNDVQAFLTETLRNCNENITLAEPFAMTVTAAKGPGPEPLDIDALLDAATKAGYADVVLRPGEAPIVVTAEKSLGVVPGFEGPLDPEALTQALSIITAAQHLPQPYFGEFAHTRPGADYRAFTDGSMAAFRHTEATTEPLTYTMTRNARHDGGTTRYTDHFTFSDGEVWDIVTESNTTASGHIDLNNVSTTRSGMPAKSHEFHAKLATARAADEQPAPSMTHIIDHKTSSNGAHHWDNDLYTFSDGETWEIITEWTEHPTGPILKAVTETSTWVDGRIKEAKHADFLAKLSTSTLKTV